MSKKKRVKRRQSPAPAPVKIVKPVQVQPGAQHVDFKVGDSVVVKPSVQDPDFGADIGGWQGRVASIEPYQGDVLIRIEWDSQTLQNMPEDMIARCEEEGLNWAVMNLESREVEPAASRDSPKDVEEIVANVTTGHNWHWLGEEGRRIQKVLAGTNPDDIMRMLDAWDEHLTDNLSFPFEAVVSEFQERGPLRAGDRVKVTGFSGLDDLYGLIVHLRIGHRQYDFPLCDLEVVDENSPNHKLVLDYAVWFANR